MKFLKVTNYDMYYNISEHFKLGELIQSDTAFNNKLYMQYMYQPDVLASLEFLCEKLLEPARQQLGHPVIVTSGYRCSMLNNMVGGALNSLHIRGYAADIYSPGRQLELARVIQTLEFHECIVHRNYIHVSIKPAMNEFRYRNDTGDKRFDFPR